VFGFSLSELAIITVILLIVLGASRVGTFGAWIGGKLGSDDKEPAPSLEPTSETNSEDDP
jgi:Sec-independent protein translocase protein TatA